VIETDGSPTLGSHTAAGMGAGKSTVIPASSVYGKWVASPVPEKYGDSNVAFEISTAWEPVFVMAI
jgi:hypothetical protein